MVFRRESAVAGARFAARARARASGQFARLVRHYARDCFNAAFVFRAHIGVGSETVLARAWN
eukprot:11188968-Lingulodinium_polyedra.AAC.1